MGTRLHRNQPPYPSCGLRRLAASVFPSLLSCLLGIPVQAQTAKPPDDAVLSQRLEAYARAFESGGWLSGNLLVARGDRVVYEGAFGMANYELEVRSNPEIRFNVASITKPMTTIILIKLAEQRKVSLKDTLARWIPDFPRGNEITVEHLARHRAGIPHRVTEDWEETVPHTAADMVEFARKKPLEFAPGERSGYSSAGFSVLARVLELASGKPYAELLQEMVFTPAGMTQSVQADSRQLLQRRASSYLPGARGMPVNAPLKDMSFLVGAGSVYSTTRDLQALLRAVRTGAFGDGVKQSYVDDDGIDWNGSSNGFRAFADWHPAPDLTVVFTGNLVTGAVDRLRRDVPRLAAGEEPTPQLPVVTPVVVAPEVLRSYEGVYMLRDTTPLRVALLGDELHVNDWLLVPIGGRRFFSPQDFGAVEVVVDGAGRPLRLDWVVDGETYACPRSPSP